MRKTKANKFGLWIMPEILHNPNLSVQEKILLAQISYLHNNAGCFASNSYFASIINVTKDRVGRIIKKLVDNGYIWSVIYQEKGNKRILKPNYEKLALKTQNVVINNGSLSSKTPVGIGEKDTTYKLKLNKNIRNNEQYKIFKPSDKSDKSRYEFNSELDYQQNL